MGEWKLKQASKGPSSRALFIGGVILWILVMAVLIVWVLARTHG